MINGGYKVTPLVGQSDFIQNIKKVINSVSENTASVLLIGERGTGKKLIAQHVHFCSGNNQTKRDFYEINCKLPNETDIKMVLNGITRFIPAEKKVTLFVNHVENLTPDLQKYFLECIIHIRRNNLKVKIISTTETNIEEMVSKGLFLGDLFYQLNTVVLNTVPLRQRKEDILEIAEYYRNTFSQQSGICLSAFTDTAKEALKNQFWKGNIDELINSVQRAFMVCENTCITVDDLGIGVEKSEVNDFLSETGSVDMSEKFLPLKDAVDQFKKSYITKVLEENGWNQTKTAQILGIQRTYVIKLINELQIRK